MKKINVLLLLLVVLVLLTIFTWPKPKLRLVFCDVGQGDAVLMIYQDKQILVDTGPDSAVLSCLGKNMAFWDRKIEAIIITHNQKDHAGGLGEIKNRYKVGAILGAETDSIRFKDLVLTRLWGSPGTENESSLVWQGSFLEFDWLLTADIGSETEAKLNLQPIEVLKVAHHGSRYSTGSQFLEKVKPQLAVISVGKNSYGHPTDETLRRLQLAGAKVLRTDQNGQIVIETDGRSWYIKSYEPTAER